MGCKIIIKDTNKMMDSKMNICIQGLKKFEEIKIILETNCFYNINAPMNWSENTFWQSEAIFLSDSNGIVSLEKSPSIGGDYTGIRSMGLFESLKAVTIESAKAYRNRIIPILKMLCVKLRAIYAKYISLRDENKKLNTEIDRLENISDRRQGTINFLRNENEELREKANDLARVRGLAGDQAVDQLIAEAKYREEMERQAKRMTKNKRRQYEIDL